MSEEILPTEEPEEPRLFESESAEEPEAEVEPALAEEPEPDVAGEPEPDVAGEPEPDVAGEPEVEVEPAEEPEVEPEVVHGVSWVPFSVYLGAWVVLAVATAVGLRGPALSGGALWAPEYVYTVYGGVGLAAFGPVLSLAVWLVARSRRERGDRAGLLTSALLRGAGAAFLGAILWLVALYVLDLYRLGVLA